MTSILTNTSAMAAIQTLRSINTSMETTQSRVSSGLRVGTASDNAAYWSIATTMRSDNGALAAVEDALGLGAAKVDTAYSAMESAVAVVKMIKDKLAAATEDGVDKSKIQEEITQLQDQLESISKSASFSGENWLQADLSGTTGKVTKSVVGSFVRDSDGTVSVKKIDYALDSSTVLFDLASVDKKGILDAVATSGTTAVNKTDVKIIKDVISTKTADDLIAEFAVRVAANADFNNMETFETSAGFYVRRYDVNGDIQTDANGKELWARVTALDPANDATLIAKSTAAFDGTGSTFTDGTNTYYYAEDQITETKTVTALTKASILSVPGASVSGRIATLGADTYIQLEANKDVWVKAVLGNITDDLAGISINGSTYDVDGANTTLPAALAGANLGFSVSDLDITNLGAVATALGGDEEDALCFMLHFVND